MVLAPCPCGVAREDLLAAKAGGDLEEGVRDVITGAGIEPTDEQLASLTAGLACYQLGLGNPTAYFETTAGNFTAEIYLGSMPLTVTPLLIGLLWCEACECLAKRAGDVDGMQPHGHASWPRPPRRRGCVPVRAAHGQGTGASSTMPRHAASHAAPHNVRVGSAAEVSGG